MISPPLSWSLLGYQARLPGACQPCTLRSGFLSPLRRDEGTGDVRQVALAALGDPAPPRGSRPGGLPSAAEGAAEQGAGPSRPRCSAARVGAYGAGAAGRGPHPAPPKRWVTIAHRCNRGAAAALPPARPRSRAPLIAGKPEAGSLTRWDQAAWAPGAGGGVVVQPRSPAPLTRGRPGRPAPRTTALKARRRLESAPGNQVTWLLASPRSCPLGSQLYQKTPPGFAAPLGS